MKMLSVNARSKLAGWHIKLEYFLIRVRLLKKMLYWFWKHIQTNWPVTASICRFDRIKVFGQRLGVYVRENGKGWLSLISGIRKLAANTKCQVLLNTHMHWPDSNEWPDPSSNGLLCWHQPYCWCVSWIGKFGLSPLRNAPVHTP